MLAPAVAPLPWTPPAACPRPLLPCRNGPARASRRGRAGPATAQRHVETVKG
jgi:hypothetical protein